MTAERGDFQINTILAFALFWHLCASLSSCAIFFLELALNLVHRYQDHMREVQNKWNTLKLNDDIWAKLIYFEQNRRLAKAYVSTPILTIDGSTNGLDGFRIGLSGIENSYRNLDSIASLRSVGHGIKLKIDQFGNILVRKLKPTPNANSTAPAVSSQCSIWIKQWPSSSTATAAAAAAGATSRPTSSSLNSTSTTSSSSASSSSASSSSSSGGDYSHLTAPDWSSWPMQEIKDCEQAYKLFDMQKFRLQLERSQAKSVANKVAGGGVNLDVDWRQCVSIISFVQRQPPLSPVGRNQLQKSFTCKTPSSNKQANLLLHHHHHHHHHQQQQQQQEAELLSDPCWIMLINIIAIDMLKSFICDTNNSTAFASPRPSNQLSAIIDSFHYQTAAAGHLVKARAKPTPGKCRLPVVVDDDVENRPPLRTSASVASLYSGKQKQQVLEYNQETSAERLRRLENFNQHLNQTSELDCEQRTKSIITKENNNIKLLSKAAKNNRLHRSSQQLSATTTTTTAAAAAAAANFYQTGEGSTYSSSSNNAIYTTFTGKYLDKQQRLKQRLFKRRQMDTSREEPTLMGNNISFKSYNQSNASARPQMNPLGGGGGIPFASSKRSIEVEARQKQLAHSLSAFDLSHGHKLNLRSLKSFKMNFDSDDDDDDQDLNQVQVEGENCKQKEAKDKLKSRNGRAALKAFNSEALEWAELAKRYSLKSRSTSKMHKSTGQLAGAEADEQVGHDDDDDDDGDQTRRDADADAEIQNSSSTISSSQLFSDELIEEDEDQEIKKKESISFKKSPNSQKQQQQLELQLQKKVSRASVGSAASSSSSGCADNDYFISHSSMSSASTQTSDDVLGRNSTNVCATSAPSQLASSSGIAGSGNGSDDFTTVNESSSSSLQASKENKHNKPIALPPSKRGAVKELPYGGGGDGEEAPSNGNFKRHSKAAIAQQRRYNIKRLIGVGEQQEEFCNQQQCCSTTTFLVENSSPPCDCNILEQNQHLSTARGEFAVEAKNTCDCCCDCLYQTCPTDQLGQDLACDCGGGGDALLRDDETTAQEEPIYDHLPRYGQSKSGGGDEINNLTSAYYDSSRSRKEAHMMMMMMMKNTNKKKGAVGSCADLNQTTYTSQEDNIADNKQAPNFKELKRSSGWLERRKYIRLLPKFMFSSTNRAAGNSSLVDSTTQDLKNNKALGTKDKKANTFGRDQCVLTSKFRRTRSSQNLVSK